METLEKRKTEKKKTKKSATKKNDDKEETIKQDIRNVEILQGEITQSIGKNVETDLENLINSGCCVPSNNENTYSCFNNKEKDEGEGLSQIQEMQTPVNVKVEKIKENVPCNREPTAPPPSLGTFCYTTSQYPSLFSLQSQQQETVSDIPCVSASINTPGFRLNLTKLEVFNEKDFKQYYHCYELEKVEQFEMEFLMNSLLNDYESDPLYNALKVYYDVQSKLMVNVHDINKFRLMAKVTENEIWKSDSATKTFTSKCGCSRDVKVTVNYSIIKMDASKWLDFQKALKNMYDTLREIYVTNYINATIEEVKINQIIDDILNIYICNTNNNTEDRGKLKISLNENELQYMMQIRKAVTILFHFARKLPPNKTFTDHLQMWIEKTISVYIQFATKEDHWFLIFNILRCPNGIGTWASPLLQLPCSTVSNESKSQHVNVMPLMLKSPEIGLCMSVLKVLLMPIAKRNEYLKEYLQVITDPIKEERWTLIDSDGEDEQTSTGECAGLKETDLIALLNQIPFEELFRSALMIEKFLNDYILNADIITGQQILQVLSFFHRLIDVLGNGMITYNEIRYKQLAKRLALYIQNCLQYFSAYLELFKNNPITKDKHLLERLALEYHMYVIKGCSYIYKTRNLATWQYFSSLPYHDMSLDTIWQLLYYLNVGFPQEFSKPQEGGQYVKNFCMTRTTEKSWLDYMELLTDTNIWIKFNTANSDSSPEDLYYLLQAFFEMANDRDRVKDWNLIKTIFLHIFHIGYINNETREICYKTSRDMLVNLALCYESLMSCLVTHLKVSFAKANNMDYLFRALPLENWKPDIITFEIISNWLVHFDFKSSENLLARIIVSHLNWGFDVNRRLFLPHNIHVRMACLVSEALNKHAPEIVGISGISESVRQVTNLLDYSSPITKEQFSSWCWSLINQLRLHMMDQNIETVKSVLQKPGEALMFTPELERIDSIYQGILENHPLDIYIGILVSLHGHSVPLICQKSFELMQKLLHDHRHAAVIRCLQLIIPLFLEIPETLANTEGFHNILICLLNADKTYLKMAKDIIYPNRVGPVLELLDNMIHHQITSFSRYGLNTGLNLVNVWLNCLTALPNWQSTNAVYLLDKILPIAIQFPNGYRQTIEYFTNYYKDFNEWKSVNSVKSLKGLFMNSSNSKVPTMSCQYPWLTLVLLDIEFNCQDSLIWLDFLQQLRQSQTKANLDAILKKILQTSKMPCYTADKLCLYKYANILATLDVKHVLFPIFGQKFFQLYMERVQSLHNDNSFQQVYGVSDKFYDFNISLMKAVKTNLKAAETLYSNECVKTLNDEGLTFYYRDCNKLMKSFLVWLEDKSINHLNKDSQNIPPHYNYEKLMEIFNGNTGLWTEYLYLPSIRTEQRYKAEKWMHKCYRLNNSQSLRTPKVSRIKTSPEHRIIFLLKSYETRLPLSHHYNAKVKSKEETITKKCKNDLKNMLDILKNTAINFNMKFAELNSLHRNYNDDLTKLYKMQDYEEILFKNCSQKVCAHPARIIQKMEKILLDECTQCKINNYREQNEILINEILNAKVHDFAFTYQEIVKTVRRLLNPPADANLREYTEIGIETFYYIIKSTDEVTKTFQFTNLIYSNLLNDLGVFIQQDQEQQCVNILELTLKRSDLIEQLSAVFVPSQTTPNCFIDSYKFLIDSYLKQCDINTLFVLFSKFDLPTWLEKYHPKLYDINDLLLLILKGLEYWSQPISSTNTSNLLQGLLRRHLIHIFQYNFPEHYGEVIQLILQRSSDQKLMPEVLYDLLNSILISCGCEQMPWEANHYKMNDVAVEFSTNQKLFTLKAATETSLMFGSHFQRERLLYGLHGLYPKYQKYCHVLSMWFYCFGYSIVVKAICSYQDLLADQISDIIFGSIIDMYAPWLIIYTEQTVRERTSNWIRELADNNKGKMLFPWSKQHITSCQFMLKPFISTLKYLLGNLPISQQILGHTFAWYTHHFAVLHVETYVYKPLHENLALLPWEMFKPNINHIDLLYDSLNKFIPESHAMLGHIFIRIDWQQWFAEVVPTIQKSLVIQTISRLFTIFVKIAFEPNIHIHINTSKIMEDAIKYPWNSIDIKEIENLLNWFAHTIEPTLVLKIPNETNYVDRAVFDLLATTCAMRPKLLTDITDDSRKRLLYIKSMIHLQRSCNPDFLTNKNGLLALTKAFDDLLISIHEAISIIKDIDKQYIEANNVMVEILLITQSQNEGIYNVHINCLKNYVNKIATPGNVLVCSILNAVNSLKTFGCGIYGLLEDTIYFYFRSSESSLAWHAPTWLKLLKNVKQSLDKLELVHIMKFNCFFILHAYILYKMEKLRTNGERIIFLQDLSQLIDSLKTEPETEPELALVWGCMIVWGCRMYLTESENIKKPLYMLAQHLQMLSNQNESWSDGLLNAIGLRKHIITNQGTMETNDEHCSAMRELSMLLGNKKFFDVKPLIGQVFTILKENSVPKLKDIPQIVHQLINVFYRGNGYLTTLPEIWQLDLKFT